MDCYLGCFFVLKKEMKIKDMHDIGSILFIKRR